MADQHRMTDQQRAFQDELRKARKQFANAIAAGQVHVLDRFNNGLKPGQKVLYRPPFDLIFDVVDVAPVFDLNMPPGAMTVTLTVTLPIKVMANQTQGGMIVLAEMPDAPAQTTDSEATGPAKVQGDGAVDDRPHEGNGEAPTGDGGAAPDPTDARSGVGAGLDLSHLPGDAAGEPF